MRVSDVTKSPPLSSSCNYRVAYKNKNWIRKPDPSGFSISVKDYTDPSALHEGCLLLSRKGHKVLGTWKWVEGKWVKM